MKNGNNWLKYFLAIVSACSVLGGAIAVYATDRSQITKNMVSAANNKESIQDLRATMRRIEGKIDRLIERSWQ